jgi:hypothetical protein
MAAQFDGINLLITLDAPTLGVLQQTAEQIYEDAKVWHLNANNRKYPFPFTTAGGEDVTLTEIAGQYYFFRNDLGWRIQTTDADQDVFWSGNLIPIDFTQRIFASRVGRTAAHIGLQPIVQGVIGLNTAIPQIADIHGQLRRSIFIDTTALTNGDGYQQTPYNNFTDAVDDAEANGIMSLVLMADATVDRQLRNFEFTGVGNPTLNINGQDVNRSEFSELQLDGAMIAANGIRARHCELKTNTSGLNGIFTTCGLQGTHTLQAGCNVEMIDCHSSVGGLGRPTINGSGGASNFALRGYRGGLNVGGISNAADEFTISMPEGKLTLLATCTAGVASVRGMIQFTNNANGTLVDITALVDVEQVRLAQELMEADQVFDQPNGLLHYYRRGTNVDLIPPKNVTTTQTQSTSLVQP